MGPKGVFLKGEIFLGVQWNPNFERKPFLAKLLCLVRFDVFHVWFDFEVVKASWWWWTFVAEMWPSKNWSWKHMKPSGLTIRNGISCLYILLSYNNIYIWVNYNISLSWIKAIRGWFPLLTMIPGLGRSEVVIIYPDWLYIPIIYLKSIYIYNPESHGLQRSFKSSIRPAETPKKAWRFLEISI
jgi:hypothetical protein